MSRQITITEIVDDKGKIVKLMIRSQSHYEKDFGGGGKNHFVYGLDSKTNVGKFVLASEGYPAFLISKHTMETYKCEHGLSVMGKDASKDHIVIDLSPDLSKEWFDLMHKAVEDYNKTNNSCQSCGPRHCNKCGIFVEDLKGRNLGQSQQVQVDDLEEMDETG
jgi:hypothetical protein